jgi:glucosylceramidase
MKSTRAYNYGKLVWEKKNLQAYAQYFIKFVEAYAKQGIAIGQIHVQNEPVADQKFPSCLWSGAELRDFIRDYMGPAFAKAGIDTEIWLGTINSDDYNGYANTVLSDPAAREYVRGVGYQWGGKWAIHRTITSYPHVPLMQTENECGDGKNTWDYAHYIFDLFTHYIIHDVRAYIYWNMILPPQGRSTWGWNQNSMIVADPDSGRIRFTPEFYVMKHFSAFIDPGAVRLGLMGPWAGNAVCFANPDGSMSLVIANPFADQRKLSFQGPNGVVSCQLAPRSFRTIRQML